MSEPSSSREAGADIHAAVRRKGSLQRTLRAVFWSFFGVRKSRDLDRDSVELNPLHVIFAGIVVAFVFVVAIVALVHWVVASGVAA
jgi:hypothetical protein